MQHGHRAVNKFTLGKTSRGHHSRLVALTFRKYRPLTLSIRGRSLLIMRCGWGAVSRPGQLGDFVCLHEYLCFALWWQVLPAPPSAWVFWLNQQPPVRPIRPAKSFRTYCSFEKPAVLAGFSLPNCPGQTSLLVMVGHQLIKQPDAITRGPALTNVVLRRTKSGTGDVQMRPRHIIGEPL